MSEGGNVVVIIWVLVNNCLFLYEFDCVVIYLNRWVIFKGGVKVVKCVIKEVIIIVIVNYWGIGNICCWVVCYWIGIEWLIIGDYWCRVWLYNIIEW